MSEESDGAPLPWAVTTCCLEMAERGLLQGLPALCSLQPPGLVLDGLRGWLHPRELRGLLAANVPVIAACGPGHLAGGAMLDAPEEEAARQALRTLVAGRAQLRRLRCPRLLVEIGGGGLPGLDATRALLDEARDPAALAASFRGQQAGPREAAVERLARRLHALARSEPGLGLLLLPTPEPLSLLDLEVAGWLLDDLGGSQVGLALDTGRVGAGERLGGLPPADWLDLLGGRVGLLLLGDHAAGGVPDLLAGTGVLPWGELSGQLPWDVPWVLRGSRDVPAAFLGEAASLLRGTLRAGPEAGLGGA